MIRGKTILIVDDEPLTRQGVTKTLAAWGAGHYRIVSVDNVREALGVLEREPVHLLITDIRMPEFSGLFLVKALNERNLPSVPSVILISGYAEFDYAQQGIQLGVVNYLLKPIGKDKLLEAVEKALAAEEQRNRIEMMRKIVDCRLIDASEHQNRLSDPVKLALRYIDEHLHLPFGLRHVAERIHLNPSYFSALFKDQLQMTFSEYVTRRRLQKAKEMLLHTNLPIVEIAERVGYQTAKYFNKLFRKYEGTSPGQYRSEMTKPDPHTQK